MNQCKNPYRVRCDLINQTTSLVRDQFARAGDGPGTPKPREIGKLDRRLAEYTSILAAAAGYLAR